MIQQTTGGLLEMSMGKVFVVSMCSFLYKAVDVPYIIVIMKIIACISGYTKS